MGKRGMHHATAFNANPRFEVAGICDIDAKPAGRGRAPKLGQSRRPAPTPRRWRKELKPGRVLLLHAAEPARRIDPGGDRKRARS